MAHVGFDIGNVICDVDLSIFTDELVKLEVVPSSEDGMRILGELQHTQDVGLTTLENYLLDVLKVRRSVIPELLEAWRNTVTPNKAMMKLIDLIANNGTTIAFLSNIGHEHVNLLRNMHGDFFNKYIQHFSCEVGARKPFKLFFQSFLFENPKFGASIYLDDKQENVDAANRAGLRGYLFKLDSFTSQKEITDRFHNIMRDSWIPGV